MTDSRKKHAGEKANGDTDIEITVVDDSLKTDAPGGQGASLQQAAEGDGAENRRQPTDLQETLAAAREEAKEAHDRMLRATAEMENFKKRSTREMADFKKFANERLIRALLPVIDNLELALQSSPQDDKTNSQVIEGVSLTLSELRKVLEGFGVKAVKAEGQPFDPKYHQAFVQEENDKLPENTVIKEFQKGYLLHERLIRPAMVIVSQKSGSAEGVD